jgi:Uma2 family endonuclease
MATVQTGLTLDEFLRRPEEKPALEFLDGVVTPKMSPKGPHSGLQAEFAFLFKVYLRLNPIAEVYTELRTNWTDRASLIPDVSVYLTERIPTTPAGDVADDFWTPPDIAVEIASPGQSANDQTARANLLLQNGVRVVVLVEPLQRRVRVARPGQPIVTYLGDDTVTIEDVLPGFSFGVHELFSTLRVRRPNEGDGS